MPNPSTARSIQFAEQQAAMSYDRMLRHPDYQAEAIAKHYASLATISSDLLKLTELRRNRDDAEQCHAIEETITHHVNLIKRTHLGDFGLALEWPEPNTSDTTIPKGTTP